MCPFLYRYHHTAFFFLVLSQSSQNSSKYFEMFSDLNLLPPFLSSLPPSGSRATVFWDHMTISQSRPPPLPMCSCPHDVASPAQSRPAHWVPPILPCPSWRTKASQTSQIHTGLKVHQSHEANQQKSHTASLAETRRALRTRRRQLPALLTLHCPVCRPQWAFLFLWVKDLFDDSTKPELLKQYCFLLSRPLFQQRL